MKKNLLIKCEEANHICDKNQYKEASFKEKIKLMIHTLYCNACRKYSLSNSKLTELFKKSNINTIAVSEKNKMKTLFEKELSKSE